MGLKLPNLVTLGQALVTLQAIQYSLGCMRVRLSREHAQEHLNDVRTLFIAHLSLNSSDL